MEAKHTPGPWIVGTETRDDEICTIHGVPRQPSEDGKGQGWVYVHYNRVIGGDWHYAGEDEQMANARLIAAAPELLEACEAVLKATDPQVVHNVGAGSARDLALAAIAKARGETQ